MDKRFLAILAAIVIGLGGFFVITKSSDDNGGSASGASPTNNVMGEDGAGVVFMEYGDFECPVCGLYYAPVKQAVEKYKDQITFQFRHLPLTSIHPNAFAAARAAEAAAKQNKFWEMHDKLFETQSSWAGSSSPLGFFRTYAQDIGLNVEQFEADFASQEINDAVNADLTEFDKTGQDKSTPTFFINGEHISNADLSNPQTGRPDVDSVSSAIDAAIAKQSQQ